MRKETTTKNILAGSILLSLLALSTSVSAAQWSESLLGQLQKHPRWKVTDTEVNAAIKDQVAASQPLYNPELELSYEDTSERAYQIGVSQQLDRSDKGLVLSQIGAVNADIARFEQMKKRNELAAKALIGMVSLRRANEVLLLASNQQKITQNLVNIAEERLRVGDIGALDVQLARLASTDSTKSLVEAQTERDRTRLELSTILGESNVALPNYFAYMQLPEPDFEELLQQEPEVLIAEAQSRKALLDVRKAEKETKADPSIGIGLGRDGNDNVVALTFSMPLFVRNTYSAEVDAARMRGESADKRLQDVKARKVADMTSSWRAYKRYDKQMRAFQSGSHDSMSRLNRQLEKLWRLGELTTTAYLQNLQQTNASLFAEIEIEAQADLNFVEWLRSSNQVLTWLQNQ
ncbi:TolC family protein [Pontibacterium granulatum]|uniref:TolC family protein n=1 Tax=Pontibacterium granulatum TaxID=2036029 RepID=UPI00249C1D6E|nr:TolC family protein [Pontibacterium granulatum]MDI3326306.1 TolC family protein [Pontibacterium granulatum]